MRVGDVITVTFDMLLEDGSVAGKYGEYIVVCPYVQYGRTYAVRVISIKDKVVLAAPLR